jgi:hypothetical protein
MFSLPYAGGGLEGVGVEGEAPVFDSGGAWFIFRI